MLELLKGEACSTYTAACSDVWCVCHYKKCDWSLIGRVTRDILKEVIEVDEIDEGSIKINSIQVQENLPIASPVPATCRSCLLHM